MNVQRQTVHFLLGLSLLIFAVFCSAAPVPATGHDGWTGLVNIHSIGAFKIDRPGRTAKHREVHDVQIVLNPGGSVTCEGSRCLEESNHTTGPRFDMQNIEVAKGSGDPENDPVIALDANDHFLARQ